MKKIILFFLMAVIMAGAGFGLGYLFFNKQIPGSQICPVGQEDSFDKGWNAARARLIELGILIDNSSMAVKEIKGRIERVENNKVLINIIPFDPLSSPDLDQRSVIIGEDTEITMIKEKEKSQYEKEMDEYKAMLGQNKYDDNDPDFPLPPMKYAAAEAGIEELKAGAMVNIEASEDISDKKEFVADNIVIQAR